MQHPRVADPNIEESDQSDDEKEPSVRQAAINNITQALQGCTFPKFLILSLTIFCLVLANVKATMSHVQFCPYMHNGIYVRMLPFRNCSIDPGSNWKVKNITIYQKQLVHIPATYCSKTTRTVCTWASFRISLQVTNDTTVV